jgi:hypothetical protein
MAECLANSRQLKHEGAVMKHCVGSYDKDCLYEGASIVSLRRDGGIRVSTVELRLRATACGLQYFVVQHRGLKNAPPTQHADRSVQALLEELNRKSGAKKREEMHAEREARVKARTSYVSHTSDAMRLQNVKAALKIHMGYEKFLDHAITKLPESFGAHKANLTPGDRNGSGGASKENQKIPLMSWLNFRDTALWHRFRSWLNYTDVKRNAGNYVITTK